MVTFAFVIWSGGDHDDLGQQPDAENPVMTIQCHFGRYGHRVADLER
jgi:hypothetical protein